MRQEEEPVRKDRKILSMFIFMGLTLIIAISGYLESALYKVILQIIAIFIQAVVLWNILEDYYSDY